MSTPHTWLLVLKHPQKKVEFNAEARKDLEQLLTPESKEFLKNDENIIKRTGEQLVGATMGQIWYKSNVKILNDSNGI